MKFTLLTTFSLTLLIATVNFTYASDPKVAHLVEETLGGPIVIHFGDELFNRRSTGIFIALHVNTPVKSLGPGKVLRSEYHTDFGGFGVEIRLSKNTSIIYSCFYRLSVRQGMFLKKNQVIGLSGGGGDICGMQGPGVRIKIKKDGQFVNPLEHLL